MFSEPTLRLEMFLFSRCTVDDDNHVEALWPVDTVPANCDLSRLCGSGDHTIKQLPQI